MNEWRYRQNVLIIKTNAYCSLPVGVAAAAAADNSCVLSSDALMTRTSLPDVKSKISYVDDDEAATPMAAPVVAEEEVEPEGTAANLAACISANSCALMYFCTSLAIE